MHAIYLGDIFQNVQYNDVISSVINKPVTFNITDVIKHIFIQSWTKNGKNGTHMIFFMHCGKLYILHNI